MDASGSSTYDLRALFRAAGSSGVGERALGQAPEVRGDARSEVEMLDSTSCAVEASPIAVAGFVDGIQSARVVAHRSHRPVYLAYASAAAVSPKREVLTREELLTVIAAPEDSQWLAESGSGLPVTLLSQSSPDLLASEATRTLGSARDLMELMCARSTEVADGSFLVVDGSLARMPADLALVGVVKTSGTRYLPDEKVLFALPRGWRSPRFVLREGFQGCPVRRYSCYVRLLDASRSPWNFGLVRLESFEPDVLDAAAAFALSETQSPLSGDRRFDRHLAGVRMVEDTLRARRPDVFDL